MIQQSSFVPQAWSNQAVDLYHGTVDTCVFSILRSIDVRRGRTQTDFGQGFYTTTVERQAYTWALRMAQRKPGSRAAVIRFEVNRDELAMLDSLWFVRGAFDAEDYWSLVFHCRNGGRGHLRKAKRGWYDIVVGPATASWQQRLALADVDQISFHTDRAAKLLDRSNPQRIL